MYNSVTFYTYIHHITWLLPDSGSAACLSKANNQGAKTGRKGSYFIQKSWQCREKVDSCPKTNSRDSSQSWQFLKGKKGRIWVNHQCRKSRSASFSIACRLADSSWSFFRCCLIWVSVWRIAKGASERGDSYLILHSYYFLFRNIFNVRKDIVYI